MPPRHTYWTILFGNQPTAFRSAEREELLPTFKQIQAKHPDAVMMWFARGRLWKSPEEARETFERRDRPYADRPPASPKVRSDEGGKPTWQNRGPKPAFGRRPEKPGYGGAPPKPEGGDKHWRDRPRGDRSPGGARPPGSARWPQKPGHGEAAPKPRSGDGGSWRDKQQGDRPKPAWQNRGPKPAFGRRPEKPGYGDAPPKPGSGERPWRDQPRGDRPPRGPRPEWRDKSAGDRPPQDPRPPRPPAFARWPQKAGYGGPSPKPHTDERGKWRDRPQGDRPKPAWQNRGPKAPRGDGPPADAPARKDSDKRGRDWRPGGAHKDPRDRFKVPRDVKRARFKQNLQRDRMNPRPPRKKKDEE